MHIVIAGGGKTGKKLIKIFKESKNHTVTVIDANRKECELLSELFPYLDIVFGDATHPETLREAYKKEPDAFIAVTSDDHLNLLAAKAAKKMGVPQVIVRVKTPEYKELAEVMELQDIIEPADSVSAQVLTYLSGFDFAKLIHELHLDIELKKIDINDGAYALIGTTIDEFCDAMDKPVYPIMICRNNKYLFPPEIDLIKGDDMIIYWERE